jgi:hypothetical protein
LKKELRNIYRSSEKAYASMDFTGKGYIMEDDFLNSLVITRVPYTKDDVKLFFKQSNLFSNTGPKKEDKKGSATPANGMNFDTFKKTFFPQLYLLNEEH